VLARMTPSAAAAGLSELDHERAAEILAETGPSAAALVLARTSESIRRAILAAMKGREADAIRRLLLHAAHTAGSVMDALVLCAADDATVGEALALVRAQADSALYYLYIIDREQRLVGVTTLGKLLGANAEDSVVGVMRARPAAILAHATLAAIVAHPGWRLYHALPVVDRDGVLLGVIRYDSARAVERELGRAVRRTNVAETASALAQLYAIGTLGMAEWITAMTATRRRPKRQGPPA